MSAILMALATGAAILLPVLILVILATIPAANRGEEASHHHGSGDHSGELAVEGGAATGASSGGAHTKLPFVPDRDPTVLEILGLGTLLFVLVMGALLGFSLMSQM